MAQDNIAPLADAYAALKHQEELLKARVSTLRDEILQLNEKRLIGEIAIVEIVDRKGAETLDKAATLSLLTSLGATPEQIAALIKVGKPTKSLVIKANVALAV